jgi:predicted regulator of Ras-like GTPase activity (Roadblock/LC7/MglB family)
MGKIRQLEDLVSSLAQHNLVEGCAVVSRLGQGDILYDTNLDGIDRTLLSTIVSTTLLIGEKLGHEIDDAQLAYHLVNYGASAVIVLPGSEDVALMVLMKGSEGRDELIEASRDISRKVGDLLRNSLSAG